ncbi:MULTISPECIES: sensor histidine kinase [Gracilibacillus]|uniref:histidine kinase n=1 Tax=Gracilibacillus dipsosauri TaxID=178340 RepID=A0A317KU41_9BACI|nr:sensor histidine kinase [Gracilibacillus dipsosauri]PWU66836.1 sensor histidine kinase [Gracilibacillus dipsosauri]
MKAYVQDQLISILFFYSQVGILLIIARLASSVSAEAISTANLMYMLLVATSFLVIYHIFRYMKYREIYQFTAKETNEAAWLPDAPDQLTRQLKEHYEKQYHAYKQQLEKLHAEKKQENMFMQQWVHQMKTPLSVISLTIENEQINLPHAFKQDMEEELDRMKNGLQLALYQSRLQQFERDFHVEKIDLNQLVRTVIQEYKSSFIRHHVYPKIEIPSNTYIYSDQKWLGFVLGQITSNAIKYASGTKTNITFSTDNQYGYYTLSIIDQGIGIPKQDIKQVFHPFFTGENGRNYQESTGMGLYLTKQICDELHHQVSIDSEVKKGTKISISFNAS